MENTKITDLPLYIFIYIQSFEISKMYIEYGTSMRHVSAE